MLIWRKGKEGFSWSIMEGILDGILGFLWKFTCLTSLLTGWKKKKIWKNSKEVYNMPDVTDKA